jgi:hypothetical protein
MGSSCLLPTNCTRTIEQAVQMIRPAADAKGISIETDLPSEIGQITGDPARLQQVVWNLLSNAVKFTPQGGRVEARLERAAPYIRITVSDTGKGISSDFLLYVFERFRQADASSARRHGGLGLGLALVKHLVELHGGTVEAASAGEGQGATFKVTLPVRAVSTPLGKPIRSSAEESSSSEHNPARFEPYRRLAMDLISVKSAYHRDKLSRLAQSSELIERHSPCVIRSLAEGRRPAPMLQSN